MEIAKCRICGKTFSFYKSASKGIYCSYDCYWKAKKGTPPPHKGTTGMAPWNKGKKIDRRTHPNMGHFRKHSAETKRKISKTKSGVKGEKHPNWKGGMSAKYDRQRFGGNREKVLERDNYMCQLCNSKENLVVHHKNGRNSEHKKPDHSMRNLITLCNNCHVRLHKSK